MPERFHFVKFDEAYWKQFKSAAKKLGINAVEFVREAAKERANVVLNRDRPVAVRKKARNARIQAKRAKRGGRVHATDKVKAGDSAA